MDQIMSKKLPVLITLTLIFSHAHSATVSTITKPFQASGGLAVSLNGDIFVADYGEQTTIANGVNVYRVNSDGEVSIFATNIKGASGNAVDKSGVLYQSSYIDNKVYRINTDGEATVFAEGEQLSGPVGIQFDSEGSMYVANCNSNSIIKKIGDNLVNFVRSSDFACPAGLAFDENDNLYVTQYANGDIHRIDVNGNITLLASSPSGHTKTNGGNGHITYGNGKLYFVSGATHQVFSLSLSGELSIVAGSGKQGRTDGIASSAEFSLPNGIDISSDGKFLFVNDSQTVGNDSQVAPNVIRKITLD